MKRRDFLKTGAMAGVGAGITVLNFPVFGKNAPSNKLVIGMMGVNSRGNWLAKVASKLPNAEVGFICDVDDKAVEKGLKAVSHQTRKPEVIKDVRKMLERKDLDAVMIAAPDHWHAPAAIMACAAGKHVYVEKPVGHNPREGELVVEAAAKYKRTVQMGNQRRSWPNMRQAYKDLQEDKILGRVYFARGWYVNDRKPIGVGKKVAVPSNLDWELWQGPAPRHGYIDNVVHYDWHWRWLWGTGEACNNGTHEVDCMRWFMGLDYPTKVTSAGGRFAYSGDDWETPDTQTITFEFEGNRSIVWEGRSAHPYKLEGSGRGFTIFGEKGSLYCDGGDNYKILDLKGNVVKEVKENKTENRDATNVVSPAGEFLDAVHISNWMEAIRGNAKLNYGVGEGAKSVLLCHLGNISQRSGSILTTDPANGHILHNKEAAQLWGRSYEKGWEPKV